MLQTIGKAGKLASYNLSQATALEKNQLLNQMADNIAKHTSEILVANELDLTVAKEQGLNLTMLDRLTLTAERIAEMAQGLRDVAQLTDPIGAVDEMWKNDDNLLIGKRRVPLGLIGIIYESRPNVTTDAAALCFKTGNAVILRGGKEAYHSNKILVSYLREVLTTSSLSVDCIQFVDDTSRETARELMQLNDYLDVLIPRGGANLIKTVLATATVPVIETGTGNCHIYVDEGAQLDMAVAIVVNAKCQRPSVCNAAETLIVHEKIASEFLPLVATALKEFNVELRGDTQALNYLDEGVLATELDWQTEFLDYVLAIKTVASTDEAILHINTYNTGHSEAIVSDNYFETQKFLDRVDAAAVYVNASTRFTDGFVFGYGAEIGISTQKLHARGPMGLHALTSTKYVIYGDGQIRG